MINKVMLIGRVGQVEAGDEFTRVSIATTEKYTDKRGKKQERTEWHRVTFFGKLAEVVDKYVSKGMLLFVEGKLTYSKDDSGKETKYYTNINGMEMKMLGGGSREESEEEVEEEEEQEEKTSKNNSKKSSSTKNNSKGKSGKKK